MKPIAEGLCSRIKRDLRIFNFLDEEDVEQLAPYLECRLAEAGEILWEEGGECEFLVFVVAGCLKVKKETEFKGKNVIVGLYGPGALAGELCMLDGSPREVTAAAQKETELLVLSRENFTRLDRENPELLVKLLKGMLLAVSHRLSSAFDRLAAIF